jgi:hypothetical protein
MIEVARDVLEVADNVDAIDEIPTDAGYVGEDTDDMDFDKGKVKSVVVMDLNDKTLNLLKKLYCPTRP